MASLTELHPTTTTTAEGILLPLVSPASPDNSATVLNDRDLDSTGLVLDKTLVSNSHRSGDIADTGVGIHGDFEVFHNYTLGHSRDSREETPVIGIANGRGESSQEDGEDSGSESWLIGGKAHEEVSENGELPQTCSSASGDGSSVWSEEGSNEQEPSHYSLLESSAESELSSPGGTPVPQSVSSQHPMNNTADDHQGSTTESSTMELKNLTTCADQTNINNPEPLPVVALAHLTTENEELSDTVVADRMETEHGSACVVNLVGHSETGDGRRGVEGGEEDRSKEEVNGEAAEEGDDGEDVEVEREEVEMLEEGTVVGDGGGLGVVVGCENVICDEDRAESGGEEGDGVRNIEGEVNDGEDGGVESKSLQWTAPEVPHTGPEPAPVVTSPPPPITTVVSSATVDTPDHRLRSSMMESEDSDDPLLESNLDSSNLDSGVRRPRDSQTNLPILQPLSPDPDLSEQYEYLRRTLSHSRRRYSTRRRRPQRKQNREGVQRSESSVGVRREQTEMRDMLQNQESRRVETHVDVHGRTYFMDHDTHTVAYEAGLTQATDISRGMEMLERRYLSLQRSFRGQRPNRFAQPILSTIPSSPSTPLDLSLSLTRAEAESISQTNSQSPRSQSGTSHSKRKSSRWRFWQRSYRSVSQSRSDSSADDDILPVSPGWEGSPPPSVTEAGEVVERERRERSGSREGSIGRSSGGSRSSDATLGGSVAETSEEGEGERGTEDTQQTRSVLSAEVQVSGGGEDEVVANGEVGRGEEEEGRREGGGGGDEVFAAAASAPAPSRHASIMRASGMSNSDRNAASRARHKVRATTVRSRHRRRGTDRDTDDETNEVPAQRHVQVTSPTPEEREEEEVKEQPATPTSALPLPEELLSSHALRFITRRDLYTFLSKAGDAGEMFLANRGLMELVQRIRTNNNLFSKYQHSRQLVSALNRFTDIRADLPQDWEKKLNREGKVFYIDHTHCLTSFIDPRLPLPDHEFTYTTPPSSHPSQQPEQLQFGEEAPIRAHHTTVMSSSAPPPPPSTSLPPSVSVTSPQPPQEVEMTYERQVVSFFRNPDIYQRISQRYHRGVRPQLREIIEDVRANGTSALERIQTSGSVAAYELALVLSLFEEDISAINTMVQIVPQQPVREERATGGPLTASTLQRKKEAFSTKLQTFKVMMARLGFAQSSRLKFNIRRDHLLEDSYEHVMKSDVRHLQRKRLNICFKGEDGLDYGGPSREFFFLLSREVFNPYYGLFEYSANDTYTVQISSTSMFIQNNLDWFRFAGRVIGLVIVQGFLLDVFFTRTIYKALANRAPSLKDLESLEPAFYNSLVWIRENDPEPLDLTFTVEEEAFGELSTHELKEGGMDIPVTEENKEEYIHFMLRWRLDRGITTQLNMLKKGFSEVMPVSLLQAFDASELEFLTAGTLEIDIDDWKKHTEYRNGYHPTHPVILFFWQAVEMFDNEQRLRLLQFVTGTSSVPFEGFKALRGSNGPKRFTIDFFSDVNSLPRTHTCFNRIDLPPYPSYDVLYHKLLTAIEEGNTFGIE